MVYPESALEQALSDFLRGSFRPAFGVITITELLNIICSSSYVHVVFRYYLSSYNPGS